MTDTINPQEVMDALRDSLYQEEELESYPHYQATEGEVPEGAIKVEGIVHNYGFHPERLESHRGQVNEWLSLLPHTFRKDGGGGWSFLQACDQEDGTQWTGEHRAMEALFVLGIGLGLARWQLPKEVWGVLPGGMPYVSISLEDE